MKKTFITLFICCLTLLSAAQNFSSFVFTLQQTKSWDAIKLFNDTLYFSISNDIQSEGFSNRIVKVSKDLSNGRIEQKLNISIYSNLALIRNNLVGFSRVQDFKNTLNGQFTVFKKDSKATRPVIIGDTSNELHSITDMNSDLILSGDYRPPTTQFGWSGFLARYNLEGQKIWEKYYRLSRNGFKTTSFDYVFHTKNNELLVIGRSQKDSGAIWQTQVITALFDTSGNLLEIKSELDSMGLQFERNRKLYLLPRLRFSAGIQMNDSTYAVLVYNEASSLEFPYTWLFFNEKGNVINSRKAWLYRDTVNNPIFADMYFKGLIKKKNGIGYYAQFLFPDSVDLHRLIALDEDLYITKVFPGIPQYSNDNISAGLFAFVEDEDKSFYQLRSFNVDSTSPDETLGSLVCKVDSNGQLLSNGPLFPVGEADLQNVQDFLLYPNPSHDKLTITIGSNQHMTLEIFNTNGKLMHSEKFIREHLINISEFTQGLYLFKFSDDKGNSFIKKVLRD